MNSITTLTLSEGFDIDILVKNGKIAYTFTYDGQSHGLAVKLKSRKTEDIAIACLLLITNAQQTYRELNKGK